MSEQEQVDIKDIKKSLARIETAVLGDKEAGTTGLVKRVANLEQYKNDDSEFKNKIKNKILGATFVGIPTFVFVMDLVKNFIIERWFK